MQSSVEMIRGGIGGNMVHNTEELKFSHMMPIVMTSSKYDIYQQSNLSSVVMAHRLHKNYIVSSDIRGGVRYMTVTKL